jgi:hypothetical protein
MKAITKKLMSVQSELKAPKEQFNKFGNYAYRNCEDILEALKPILRKYEVALIIEDEISLIGDRFYIKAVCTLTDGSESIKTSAYARESLDKKGMDDSQITGSTSSYARKYALNGMFLIDDNKDADTTNTHEKEKVSQPVQVFKKLTGQNNSQEPVEQKPKTYTVAKPTGQLASQKQIDVLKKFFPGNEITWETLTSEKAKAMFDEVNNKAKK